MYYVRPDAMVRAPEHHSGDVSGTSGTSLPQVLPRLPPLFPPSSLFPPPTLRLTTYLPSSSSSHSSSLYSLHPPPLLQYALPLKAVIHLWSRATKLPQISPSAFALSPRWRPCDHEESTRHKQAHLDLRFLLLLHLPVRAFELRHSKPPHPSRAAAVASLPPCPCMPGRLCNSRQF